MQRGACQEAARTRRRGHGAIDRAPCAGVLDGPQRLDPWGRESPSAHRQEAHTTGVLTAHAHGVGMHRWQDARQPLLTGRLQRSNGLWVFFVCLGGGRGGAGPHDVEETESIILQEQRIHAQDEQPAQPGRTGN